VRRRRRIAEDNNGVVPAYAVGASGALVDVAPAESRPARRVTQPQDPAQGVSKAEFDDMVRDLHVEAPPTATAERDPTADLDPEDLVLKDDKPKTPKPKRPRNRRHGRSR
jgi:SecD/SecF fusion protein